MNTVIINPSDSLRKFQETFEREYPFLKVEFFRGEHEVGELSIDREKVDINSVFSNAAALTELLEVNLSPEITVAEFEQSFRKLPNLGIQVYRKSGRVYLETATTDEWTLEEQNTKGKEMSEPVID
ncbi:MAG: hypothetical protein ACK4K0_09835 [Flavobacteriales bacterium]